jgi:hypothetical protein
MSQGNGNMKNDLYDYADKAISLKTRDIVERIRNSTTDVLLKFLDNNADKYQLRNKVVDLYKYENLLLFRSNGINSKNIETNLKIFERLKLTPKYITYFELGDNDYLTVVQGAKKKLDSIDVLDAKAQNYVQIIKNKLIKMHLDGYLNQEMYANKNLYFNADDERIIYADWNEVVLLRTPQERQQMVQQAKRIYL